MYRGPPRATLHAGNEDYQDDLQLRVMTLSDVGEKRALQSPSAVQGSRSNDTLENTRAESSPRPLGELPRALSSFIGREHEITEIRRLLGETRLLTLTGPGGCGKTRLAMAVAFDVVDDF